jgi:hypothetical protein
VFYAHDYGSYELLESWKTVCSRPITIHEPLGLRSSLKSQCYVIFESWRTLLMTTKSGASFRMVVS